MEYGGKDVNTQQAVYISVMAIDLKNKEIRFVNENFENISEREDYLYAVFEGNAKALERVLENYLLISSTSFIHSQTHDKSKEHKRFSATGKYFYKLYVNFFRPFSEKSIKIGSNAPYTQV
jgi:t-SNARE complex subunit (syntaxin)